MSFSLFDFNRISKFVFLLIAISLVFQACKKDVELHDGRFSNLEEVVNHYNEGLFFSSTIDPAQENTRATGLLLTIQDKADLVAFLNTLTDRDLTSDPRYASPF